MPPHFQDKKIFRLISNSFVGYKGLLANFARLVNPGSLSRKGLRSVWSWVSCLLSSSSDHKILFSVQGVRQSRAALLSGVTLSG